MNAQRPQSAAALIQQCVQQMQMEVQQANQLGRDTPEGQQHLQRAHQLRQQLIRYQEHMRMVQAQNQSGQQTSQNATAQSGQANSQQSAPQGSGAGAARQPQRAPHSQQAQPGSAVQGVQSRTSGINTQRLNIPAQMQAQQQQRRHDQSQGSTQGQGQTPGQAPNRQSQSLPGGQIPQSLQQQQFRAPQTGPAAAAGLQNQTGIHQRYLNIEELRRGQQELQSRIDRAEAALPQITNPDDVQRVHQTLQAMRNRLEQYRMRESQLMQEVRIALSRQGHGGQPHPSNSQHSAASTATNGSQGQTAGGTSQQNANQGLWNQSNMGMRPPQERGPTPAAAASSAATPATAGMLHPTARPLRTPDVANKPANDPARAQRAPLNAANSQAARVQPGQVPAGAAPPQPVGTAASAATGSVNTAQPSNAQRLAQLQNQQRLQQASSGRTSTQSIPVSAHISVAPPQPVSARPSRPTLTNGGATDSPSLTTPAMTRVSNIDFSGDRVLSKRKLQEMVAAVLDDENEALIDGDVEEILLDLADEFVASVTSFACRIAKHRKSESLEAKDIHMHLERNWNMHIPGYSSDEVRSIRKYVPTPAYQQKLAGISMSKSVNNNKP